MRKQLF